MIKIINFSKKIFHILVLLLIIISLYPGSIAGYVFYGNIHAEANLFNYNSNVSLNHFYTYLFISSLGFFSYLRERKFKLLVVYLFILSIVLEAAHYVIPIRAFEMWDLIGNFLGLEFHDNLLFSYIGISISSIAIALFISSKITLGKNYSPCYDQRKPKSITSSGLYKYVRHPIYTSNVLLLIGTFVISGSYLMLINIFISWGIYLNNLS